MPGGRLGHIDGARRVGHVPRNGIRQTNYRYGLGGWYLDLDSRFGLNSTSGEVTAWTDLIGNVTYSIPSGNGPQYVLSDANFNSFPVLNFQSGDRLITDFGGVLNNKTVAFVLQRTGLSFGVTTARSFFMISSGSSFTLGSTVSSVAQPYVGFSTSNATYQLATSDIYDGNVHIIVISGTNYIADGNIVTLTHSVDPIGSLLVRIGGTDTGAANGIFRVARIMGNSNLLDSDECLLLSEYLNNDYAIY